MRASRLISLMMRLQARGRLTATNMADELQVSVRTIYRDIDQLSAAGIPVVADRGCNGGFKLVDGFRAQLGALTEAEAETLFLAALPGPAAELGLTDLMETARSKLVTALPGGVKTERFGSRFHLDTKGWFRATEPVLLLPTIAEGVRRSRLLKIRYVTDGHAASRKVGPAGLVLKGGAWYLVAQKGDSFRTYRVARISAAEVLEAPYVRPPGFDLPAYWARSSRDFEVSSYRTSATVRLSPRGRSLLELLGPYVMEAVAKSSGEPDRRGWVRCTIPLENPDFGVRELMRLGEDVEVLSPHSLRMQLARTLRQTLRNYSGKRVSERSAIRRPVEASQS
jgi:predicted DNA-binding transcriptional regulator YafY